MRLIAPAARFMRWTGPATVAALIAVSGTALAMAPLARPEGAADIETGKAAPFVGSWSLTLPTRDVSQPDTDYATCARPVRIETANETHIFYLGPDEQEADAAIELVPNRDGARWEPIAGGPIFFALWVSQDEFYLYDDIPPTETGWGMPFVYKRCPVDQ